MNKTQKSACYGLLLTLLFLSIPLIDKYESRLGLVWTHVIGYCVLLPALIVPLYFLGKKKTSGEVDFDERDKAIIIKGIIVGLVTIASVGIIGYIVTFLREGETGVISTSQLPVYVFAGFTVFIFTLSAAVLLQYKLKGLKHE